MNTKSTFLYSSIFSSIYEAVKHGNIFGKRNSPGPIIRCLASYHGSICPNKANVVQDHGYFYTVKFLLRSSQIFTLRVKTSPNEKKILPLLTLNVKVFYIKGNFYIKGCNKGYYIHQKISTYMYVKNYWITLCVHHPSLKLHKHFINSRMLPSITVRSCILVHNFYQVLVHRNFTMLCLPYWILPGAP